ncbi:YHYH protein [Monaibacterium marinum]|uniref:YHYH protein n=1 Tax=Pontivivens marinum TaxID=1690039 RepID=A0A2C9CVP7_9RHOB|nr:YHYH protein [Monaibacterium marinum]SOH95338.1 YHYH protein [Monaibacterium marinum]
MTIRNKTSYVAAAAMLGSAMAPQAQAHDITDAFLTERSANCADYVAEHTASVTDLFTKTQYDAAVAITTDGQTCTIASNAVPNHDFNTVEGFVNGFSEQDQAYTITATPTVAETPMPLTLGMDNAVFLNGVKLDLLAAGCYGIGDGLFGCFDMTTPYRFDPMGAASNMFGTDAHNAHTQTNGLYHYHGNPLALFEQVAPDAAPPVIGFAADGFPIFGRYINDDGTIRAATTSYRLKTGTRPDGDDGPGGTYDGTYVDDWEFVEGLGDLDQCNGMIQDGVYGYVVTATYPHVMACFTGTPDPSFLKPRP